MDNQSLFSKTFNKLLSEDISTGSAGVGGVVNDLFGNTDSYATGDARIPYSIYGGVVTRRGLKKKKRKKKKKS